MRESDAVTANEPEAPIGVPAPGFRWPPPAGYPFERVEIESDLPPEANHARLDKRVAQGWFRAFGKKPFFGDLSPEGFEVYPRLLNDGPYPGAIGEVRAHGPGARVRFALRTSRGTLGFAAFWVLFCSMVTIVGLFVRNPQAVVTAAALGSLFPAWTVWSHRSHRSRLITLLSDVSSDPGRVARVREGWSDDGSSGRPRSFGFEDVNQRAHRR